MESELSLSKPLAQVSEPADSSGSNIEWRVVQQNVIDAAEPPESASSTTTSTDGATTPVDTTTAGDSTAPTSAKQVEQEIEITLPALDNAPKVRPSDYFANTQVQQKLLSVASNIVAMPRAKPSKYRKRSKLNSKDSVASKLGSATTTSKPAKPNSNKFRPTRVGEL
jgi:hypothetical protein